MKLRLCLAFALSLLLATHPLSGDEPPQKAPPTVSVPLEYLDATEAYQKLRADFPKIAEMVQDIQIRTNTLTLNPAHPQYDELRQKLAKIDVRPPPDTAAGGHQRDAAGRHRESPFRAKRDNTRRTASLDTHWCREWPGKDENQHHADH